MNLNFFLLMRFELSLTLIIFILLFIKIQESVTKNSTLYNISNFLLLIHFVVGLMPLSTGELFSGMFHTGNLLQVEKSILSFGTLLISMQAGPWLKNQKNLLEFYVLLLTTLLGMFFMLSSKNLLLFFLGLELASIPLAALVNFDLNKVKSSEAAIKIILSSAFASAVMLYGVSMLYGITGSLNITLLPDLITAGPLPIAALVFIFTGFAFKLSMVPFHLWTADVYEGAPVAVTSYLSVISKASMVFVFISVLNPLFLHLQEMWYNMLYLTIVITICIGNLFALRQDNIKRFLAFSSIAQVGFILLGLSANNITGTTAAIYFLVIYLFSNLGAFGVIAMVSDATGKENISDFNGFYKTNKWLAWVLAICLFSLAGVPPTAGFFGKMFLVTAGAGKGNYILVTIAALNMVVSLYYYLRVVKAMFVDENAEPLPTLKGSFITQAGLLICLLGVVVTGFFSGLYDFIISLL